MRWIGLGHRSGALGALLGVFFICAANAATLTVTTAADSGPGSLRQTIADAAPGDTIDFGVTGVITLAAQLGIDKDLTITGPGAADLAISGNGKVRVMRIAYGSVHITGLTIRYGKASGNDGGGGISNAGTLTMRDCTLYGNTVSDLTVGDYTYFGVGGGLYNAGEATLERCQITDNVAGTAGAVFSGSTWDGGGTANLVLTDCLLQSNSVRYVAAAVMSFDKATLTRCKLYSNRIPGSGYDGSTLFNFGTALLRDCELRNNSGNCYCAGIENVGYLEAVGCTVSGTVAQRAAVNNFSVARLTNCTIASNSAQGSETAGGVQSVGLFRSAITTITNCTIAGNAGATGAAAAVYAGILGPGLTSSVYLRNTILTRRSPTPSILVASAGKVESQGYNLASDAPAALSQASDRRGLDPLLGPLADNGGPVRTQTLLPGSPAADAGSPSVFPATDSRGFARPCDCDADGVARSDIGAFEAASPLILPAAATGNAYLPTPIGAVLRGAVNPNSLPAHAHFEWGLDLAYGHASTDQDLGSGSDDIALSSPIAGLTPGKVWHYRLVAQSGAGPVPAADQSFATPNPGPGTALSFTPGGRYVELPAATWFDGDFTIEGWVYVRNRTCMTRLVEFGNGPMSDTVLVSLSSGTTGRPWFRSYAGGTSAGAVTAPTAIPMRRWTHIACTLKGTKGTLYVNGTPVATGTMSVPLGVPRRANTIGWHNWENSSSYDTQPVAFPDAAYDDLRLWNVARSADQIRQYRDKSVGADTPGLVALYRFDEGAGRAVHDAGPNGLHGTIVGPPEWLPSAATRMAVPAPTLAAVAIESNR
jgi:hypothetical protein